MVEAEVLVQRLDSMQHFGLFGDGNRIPLTPNQKLGGPLKLRLSGGHFQVIAPAWWRSTCSLIPMA